MRTLAKRSMQVHSIITKLQECALAQFTKVNYAAPIHFSLLDHIFTAWCFCYAYTNGTPTPTTFDGKDVRATYERIHNLLEPSELPDFPDELKTKVCHIIVGLFGRTKDPVIIEAEKDPWQPPLLPASDLAQADEEQRQRLHVAYNALGVYTHSNHYIPDDEDSNARLPPIEMRQPIDSISFTTVSSRLWFWTMLRQKLLSGKIIDVWHEGQHDFFESACVRLATIITNNARIEFQPKSELAVRDTSLFRLCPIGSLPNQMRVQHCIKASVLSAGSVFQGERGFNIYNRYAETLKLRYPKFHLELRERRGDPKTSHSDGTMLKPPGTSVNMTLWEMELINTSWVMAVINRWVATHSRWSHRGLVKSLNFEANFILLEHELATRIDVLHTPTRDAATRRPIIVEIQHQFYVHYFPPHKYRVPYTDKGYIIEPDPRNPDPVLVRCKSFEEAFCKWCYIVREFYDSTVEQRLSMDMYISAIMPDSEAL